MDSICTYLYEITETVWFESNVKNDHIYTDGRKLTVILENNNIPFVITSTPYMDRIYVKMEDAYNYKLRKERDDKLNELLK